MDTLSPQPILDGELLRAFAAFAECLNFTKAAEQVHLSQPALFERVRRASDLIGADLYEREGREVRLTEPGTKLAAFARDMLSRAATFDAELHGQLTEAITIAAGEGAYLYLLGPAIARFTVENTAQLHFLTLGAPAARDVVRRGEAQLAVGVFDLVPRGLIAKDIVKVPLCAALSETHPLAQKRRLRLKDLAEERLILAPQGRSQRDVVSRAVASLGGSIAPPIEADGWPQMLAFAAAKVGVAVVNGICQAPRGVVLLPIPELGSVTYRLLYRREAPSSAAVERLISLITARQAINI